MRSIIPSLALALVFACPFLAKAQDITATPLTENLYVLTTGTPDLPNTMNNLVLRGPDGLLMIDTLDPVPELYPFIRSGLDQISTDPLVYLINTHWHSDHTGLNAAFGVNEGTSRIYGHWRAAKFLSEGGYIEDFDMTVPPLPEEGQLTDLIYFYRLLKKNGENILMTVAPPKGHSNTDLFVYFLNSNVLHMGDIYFGHLFPFYDRTSGGTLQGMIRGCQMAIAMTNSRTVIVPSHGPLGNRAALIEYKAMLQTVLDRIQPLVEQGMSEEEVLAAQPIADLEQAWGWFFINSDFFTAIVYRDLASQCPAAGNP